MWRNAGKQTFLIGTVTGAQLWREELGDVRAVEIVAVRLGVGSVICELCERSKLFGKGCQTVIMEASNRRASMGSVRPSMVDVQGCQCSETADLCGKGCQSVVMERPQTAEQAWEVCSHPW